ncbi:MAG: DUF1016 family protein [Verrucomicrobia bacterium]|nr:DUF1016 family protein [Verrucomicrobiota bacterium]
MKYRQLIRAIESASHELSGRVASVANQALVVRNWLVGAYLVEFEQRGDDRAKYGEQLLERLAADLEAKDLKGFSLSNLRSFRQLYRCYPQIGQTASVFFPEWSAKPIRQSVTGPLPARSSKTSDSPIRQTLSGEFTDPAFQIDQTVSGELALALLPIRQTLSGEFPPLPVGIKPLSPQLVLQLTWSHLLELLRLDDPLKRIFYENESLKGRWSVRQLQRQIGSLLFERTGLSKDKAAVLRRAQQQNRAPDITDLLRDPYVLEFTGLAERPAYSENDLETALLDHLQSFLLELGAGFCFEARQKSITVGNRHEHVDLVFYHRLLRCHILLDLKIRAFVHADAGQMNFYLNWWKAHGVAPGDNPPIGIILCSDQDQATVEFATGGLDQKLFISRYLVALPSAKQLTRFLEQDRDRLEALWSRPVVHASKSPTRKKPRPNRKIARPLKRVRRR